MPSLNEAWGKNPQVVHRLKKRWTTNIHNSALIQGVVTPKSREPSHYTFYHALESLDIDPDNITGFAQKVILDAVLGPRFDGCRRVLGIGHTWEVSSAVGTLLLIEEENGVNPSPMADLRKQMEEIRERHPTLF